MVDTIEGIKHSGIKLKRIHAIQLWSGYRLFNIAIALRAVGDLLPCMSTNISFADIQVQMFNNQQSILVKEFGLKDCGLWGRIRCTGY